VREPNAGTLEYGHGANVSREFWNAADVRARATGVTRGLLFRAGGTPLMLASEVRLSR
jgi:hypothetical protein